MDFAPAAAIVKENKRLSERPSQEFNAAHKKKKKRGKEHKTSTVAAASDSLREGGGGGDGGGGGGRLICRQIDLFFHLVLQI